MLTAVFFIGGLVAFTYCCWWIYENEREPDGMLPRRGLLAMAGADDLAEDKKKQATPAWKRGEADANAAAPAGKRARTSRAQWRTRR